MSGEWTTDAERALSIKERWDETHCDGSGDWHSQRLFAVIPLGDAQWLVRRLCEHEANIRGLRGAIYGAWSDLRDWVEADARPEHKQ
jgi:hypothetical protein